MTTSLAQIQKKIDKLTKQAVALKAKESVDVIARIKEAIDYYGLTADQLFGGKAKKAASVKSVKAPAKKRGAKAVPVVKFRDEAGNSWTGRGRNPEWFKAAIAAGKKPEDLLVK